MPSNIEILIGYLLLHNFPSGSLMRGKDKMLNDGRGELKKKWNPNKRVPDIVTVPMGVRG